MVLIKIFRKLSENAKEQTLVGLRVYVRGVI
jgi:hypothetical protein